jgi:LPS sulfotransferase NodH
MRRTGSNHLFNVLRNFDELASCGELFNEHRVSGSFALLPQIRDITGLRSQVEEDPFLWGYAHGNPGAFLEVVAQAAARQLKQAYCFKIFEDQLDLGTIEDILARPRMHLVLLTRRFLDAYVSLQKAKLTQQWVGSDTTHLTVTLDAEDFALWLRRQQAWYRHWLDWAKHRGQRVLVLRYEEDVDRPLPTLLWRFARAMRSFDVHLGHPRHIRNEGLERQDKRRSTSSSIANWQEFAAACQRLGLKADVLGGTP